MSILNSSNQSANSSTAPVAGQNEVNNGRPNGRNRFDMNALNLFTARFGELTPFFAFQTTEQDDISLAVRHETRSYTMSAPLMSGVKMVKDTFAVPYNAIMPRNWDKYYKNPKFGDDVPLDCALVAPDSDPFWNPVRVWVDRIFSHINDGDVTEYTFDDIADLLRNFIGLEYIFSNGSLPSLLGYHCSSILSISAPNSSLGSKYVSFDTFFEFLLSELRDNFAFSFSTEVIEAKYIDLDSPLSDWHLFLNFLRSNPSHAFSISQIAGKKTPTQIFSELNDIMYDSDTFSSADVVFNYSPLVAYQLICAQFYTNDDVDEIYSSDLYLSLGENYFHSLILTLQTFDYNGTRCLYDVFSWHNLKMMLSYTSHAMGGQNGLADDSSALVLDFLSLIFRLRNSLKFGDYYVGARKTPLALGDVTAPVVNNKVSAIDTTKSIVMQRFLNAVNKVGQQLQEYTRQLLGGNLPPDVRLPKQISHEVEQVSGDEIENTAENQGAIVQNIRNYGGKYIFETSFSCPAIVVGILYFDASRVYSRNLARWFMQVDRFDMFNPYLQTIGDQPVYRAELDSRYPFSSVNFAYQTRNNDMKQLINICSGGFVEDLPSWAFVCDNDTSGSSTPINISSEFIRSQSSEFDRFFSALSGQTLSKYFHFIVKMDINVVAKRSMLRTPSIL